jgi:hypothetical protein
MAMADAGAGGYQMSYTKKSDTSGEFWKRNPLQQKHLEQLPWGSDFRAEYASDVPAAVLLG